MYKHILFFGIIFMMSCYSNRVTVLDSEVIKEEKVLRFTKSPDTLKLMTLWSGEIITIDEFNQRWDKSIKNITKKIKKEIKKQK